MLKGYTTMSNAIRSVCVLKVDIILEYYSAILGNVATIVLLYYSINLKPIANR